MEKICVEKKHLIIQTHSENLRHALSTDIYMIYINFMLIRILKLPETWQNYMYLLFTANQNIIKRGSNAKLFAWYSF